MNSSRIKLFTVVSALTFLIFTAPASARNDVYRFSVNPWGTADEMKTMFSPFLDFIEDETGLKFEFVYLPSYDDVLKELKNGYIHFAAINAVTFLKLRRSDAPVSYLVSSVRSFGEFERDYYLGYIITRQDSDIKTFDDLRNRTFGFVEESSGSGYKMPKAMLGLRNETPESFFRKSFFLGDHDEVAKAVNNGCVDAGATWEASYIINVRRFGEVFRIVAETPPIPNDAWVIRNELPEELREKIKALMLSLSRTTRNSAGNLVLDESLGLPETGFVEKSPEFYEEAAPLLLFEEQVD